MKAKEDLAKLTKPRLGGLEDAYRQTKGQWLGFLFLVPILGVFG